MDETKPEVNDAEKIGKTLLGQDYVSVYWYKNGFVDEKEKKAYPMTYGNYESDQPGQKTKCVGYDCS